jgi:alpha-glucosidase
MKISRQRAEVFSPDKSIHLKCWIADSLAGEIQYAVFFNNEELLMPSGIELAFKGQTSVKNHLKVVNIKQHEEDETWERVWGKRKVVRNAYNELKLEMEEKTEPQRKINLYFRVFNDGLALRYELPNQKGLDTIMLANEKISYNFNHDHTIWATFWNTFHLSQEKEFPRSRLSDIKPGNIVGTPLLIKAGENAWMALLEANVTDWPCAGFTAGNSALSVVSTLAPLPDDSTLSVRTTKQRLSPWKVMMIGDHPGRFIESDILQNLNEPCALKDVSWIRPGIAAWDWWWCGSYAPDAGFKLGSNTQTMKYFIDFAAEMDWEYQLVDWHWYGEPFRPDGSFNLEADITRMSPEINIPELVEYAAGKGIRIILWLLWPNVEKQMDEAFALYEKWGVAGVKIDFMDRNDQEMVNFYHRVARTAARHHLLVDFHGAYVPDGFSRTYPNLITREGVLGNEYNKWSDRVTPEHCLTIPFTRMLAGEMDFTPGGFLNAHPGQFMVVGGDSPAPMVMGTRCFQLAMLVVYESALQVFCESPYNVRNQPGSEFLKDIPATWDETDVIEGYPGESIAIARRSGDVWYVAGMSTSRKTFNIRLDFLKENIYHVITWCDATDSEVNPRNLTREEKVVNSEGTLTFDVVPNGGFTAILTPGDV